MKILKFFGKIFVLIFAIGGTYSFAQVEDTLQIKDTLEGQTAPHLMYQQIPTSKTESFLNTLSINNNFGLLLFYGDIRQYDFYPVFRYHTEWNGGYGAILNKSFIDFPLSIQAQILMGKLSGTFRGEPDDTSKPGENLYKNGIYFKSDITEISLSAKADIISLINPETESKIRPYATLGLGILNFRSIQRKLWTNAHITSFGYSSDGNFEGRKITEFVFPLAIGCDYELTEFLFLNIETSLRFTNTDKLDAKLENKATDKYQYTCLGITYKLFKKELGQRKIYEVVGQ